MQIFVNYLGLKEGSVSMASRGAQVLKESPSLICPWNHGTKLEKCSMELTLIERSTEPLTSLFPLRFKHLTVPECPASVRTTSESSLLMSHTLIVLSYEPLAILVSSN